MKRLLGLAVAIGVPVWALPDVLTELGNASVEDLATLAAFVFFSAVAGVVVAFGNSVGTPDGDRFDRTDWGEAPGRFGGRYDHSGPDWNEINRSTASAYQDSSHVVSGQFIVRTGPDHT